MKSRCASLAVVIQQGPKACTEEVLGNYIDEARVRLAGLEEPPPATARSEKQPSGMYVQNDGTITTRGQRREIGRVQQIPGGFEGQHGHRTFRLASRSSVLDIIQRLEAMSHGQSGDPGTR